MDAMRFIVLTFATEGPPHDHGVNLVEVEQGFRRHVAQHADVYLTFTPRRLTAEAPEAAVACRDYSPWLERHPGKGQLRNFNPVWARAGFLMWKPHLLELVVGSKDIAEGDVVLYHDVNFHKYPVYVNDCAQWRSLSCELLGELKADIFVPRGNRLKRDVKSFLIQKYLGDRGFDLAGVWAGLILMRKSRDLLEFLREWKEMSSQLDNISPLPDDEPHRDFVWHSVDQSTMGVLAQLWRESGRLPMDWPRYEVRGRHFAKGNLIA